MFPEWKLVAIDKIAAMRLEAFEKCAKAKTPKTRERYSGQIGACDSIGIDLIPHATSPEHLLSTLAHCAEISSRSADTDVMYCRSNVYNFNRAKTYRAAISALK